MTRSLLSTADALRRAVGETEPLPRVDPINEWPQNINVQSLTPQEREWLRQAEAKERT